MFKKKGVGLIIQVFGALFLLGAVYMIATNNKISGLQFQAACLGGLGLLMLKP